MTATSSYSASTGSPPALSPAAAEWLAGLPAERAPRQMAEAFPHVANQIACMWKTPRLLDRYLDDLLVDRRGNRQGFPFPVAFEIMQLRDYYQSVVFPLKTCFWDGVS
jgi:hypothetical protein